MTGYNESARRSALRKKAERLLKDRTAGKGPLAFEDVHDMLYEFEVQRIELEMQNEELRRTREELHRSRDLYLDLFQMAPLGYAVLDEGGTIRLANGTLAEMLGTTPFHLLHRPFSRYLHPDDQRAFLARFNAFFRAPRGKRLEVRFPLAEGETLFARLEGRRARAGKLLPEADEGDLLLVSITDVTASKRAEEALSRAQNELEQVFNAATPLCLVDTDYRLRRVNDTFCRYFDVEREEVLGRRCHEIWETSFCSFPCCCLLARAKAGEDECVGEARKTLVNGEEISFLVKGVPFRGAAGEVIGIVENFMDITPLRRAEAERARLKDKVRRVEKMESLEYLTGAVAHHFNNILAAVLGNLELALDDLAEGSPSGEFVRDSMEASHRAVELSRQMLSYLGQSPLRKETVDFSRVCEGAFEGLRTSFPRHVRSDADFFSSPGLFVRADRESLRRLLACLTNNALEALGEEGGRIVASAGRLDAETIRRWPLLPPDWEPRDDVYACLSVSDDGCGMAPDVLEKSFDPFFSTKFTGRGLGLPMALGTVRAHGGALALESEPGRGTVARAIFPLAEAAGGEGISK